MIWSQWQLVWWLFLRNSKFINLLLIFWVFRDNNSLFLVWNFQRIKFHLLLAKRSSPLYKGVHHHFLHSLLLMLRYLFVNQWNLSELGLLCCLLMSIYCISLWVLYDIVKVIWPYTVFDKFCNCMILLVLTWIIRCNLAHILIFILLEIWGKRPVYFFLHL